MEETRSKIIYAAITQIGELGWTKASTKSIAEVAEVNELTLFRLFHSKRGLLEEILATIIAPISQKIAVIEPVDITVDLVALFTTYQQLVSPHPRFVINVLSEVHNPGIKNVILPFQQALFSNVRAIFTRYNSQLRQTSTLDDAVLGFMGPLLARSYFVHLQPSTTNSPNAYVDAFLTGYLQAD